METALVTAVGSASAHTVTENLRRMGMKVLCCDIYPKSWNAVPMEADGFFQSLPATDGEPYVRQMLEAVKAHQVRWLIPLTDPEVDILCTRKQEFSELGCTICVPEPECAALCRDKLRMAEKIAHICLTIPTRPAKEWEPDTYPIMLKPLHGRSSQNQHIVQNAEEYRRCAALRDDYIAQPFIRGDIYVAETARDRFGETQVLVRHELLRTGNGLGTTVQLLPGHELEKTASAIAREIGLIGTVNMEFIGSEDGYRFLEVNPRFSGGVGFACAAGCDFIALEIACHRGEHIGQRKPVRNAVLTRSIVPVITDAGSTEA